MVTVWTVVSRKAGREYRAFQADLRRWGQGRPQRSDLDSLKAVVRQTLAEVGGRTGSRTLKGSTLREYERATELSAPLKKPIDQIVYEATQLEKLAKEAGCTPQQAIEYYSRNHGTAKSKIPIVEAVEEFIDYLKSNGNSKEDIASVRSKLSKFGGRFTCSFPDVSRDDFVEYFDSVGGSVRNRQNHRTSVSRFVNWAKSAGYLPPEHPGIPKYVGRIRSEVKRIRIYSSDDVQRMIQAARPEEKAIMLLKAYLPIRQKEACQLNWDRISFEEGTLVVDPEFSKVRQGRIMRIPPKCLGQLKPLCQPGEDICKLKSAYKVLPRIIKKAGLSVIKNGLRATVISHLYAAIDSEQRVAEEAGTSRDRLKRNYLWLGVPKKDARAYFGLSPGELHPADPGFNAAQAMIAGG